MKRRTFLGALTAAAFAQGARSESRSPALQRSLITAWAERDVGGILRYRVGCVDADNSIEVAHRAHGVVSDPTRADSVFVAARRPGEYLHRIALSTGRVAATVDTDESFRFEGHAIVERERGRVLTTETDLLSGQGRVGVYDCETLERLATWPSGAIGPHELIRTAPDLIAVANGGILTLPETGRVKRNVDRMAPSLTLIDVRDGRRIGEHVLPDPQASIRHLALADDGTIGAALQIESADERPLLAVLTHGELRFAEAPTDGQPLVRYGAGIAACGDRFAVSCTQAHCVAVWDLRGRYVGRAAMRSPSGLVTQRDGRGWVASNAIGDLVAIDSQTLQTRLIAHSMRQWDNHLALA